MLKREWCKLSHSGGTRALRLDFIWSRELHLALPVQQPRLVRDRRRGLRLRLFVIICFLCFFVLATKRYQLGVRKEGIWERIPDLLVCAIMSCDSRISL